jgi:hypothetical protein
MPKQSETSTTSEFPLSVPTQSAIAGLKHIEKGAFGESVSAAWYLSHGCNVSRPLVPLAYDLIVERSSGRLDRIQVKYVSWTHNGTYRNRSYQELKVKPFGKAGGKPKYDYLFVIGEDGRTWELPAEAIKNNNLRLSIRGGYAPKQRSKWDKYLVQWPKQAT